MATMDSERIIKEIIENDGYYLDDPRVFQIIEYTTLEGRIAYGVSWENESEEMKHRYEKETEFIRSPELIWRAADDDKEGT